MKEKILSVLFKYVTISFFMVIIAFLTILSFFNTSVITHDYTEITLFVRDNPLRVLIVTVVFTVLLYLIFNLSPIKKIREKINEEDKLFKMIEIILLALILGLGLFWVLTARFSPTADQYSVQLAAAQMRAGNFESAYKNAYLARNPQQAGIVLISYLISFVIGKENYMALEVINVLLLCVIYKSLSDIGKEMGMTACERLLVIGSAIIFPVPLFYVYFIYGLIPGLAFSLSAIKHEIRFFKDRKTSDLIFCGIFTSLALLVRTNDLIIFIAMVIYAVVKIFEIKEIKAAIVIPVLLISLLFQSFIPVRVIETMSGCDLHNGMSSLSYIAMGLQDGERAPGWYNGYNNDSYEAAGYDAKRQKDIALKNIDERLEYFSEDPGVTFEFFMKKEASQWNNPTFQVFWNLGTKIKEYETRPDWVTFFMEKKGAYDFQKYLNVMQSIILFGTLGWIVLNDTRKERMDTYLMPLAFIGGFLFHLFWEAKAQYTFVYFILLMPYALKGYKKLIDRDFSVINRSSILPLVLKGLVIAVILILFMSGKTAFLDKDTRYCYFYINDLEYEETP